MKNHNQYNGGIPDVWYSGNRSDLWIEYKFVTLPKRDTTLIVPGLSDLQQNWIESRFNEGRNVGVVVGCKSGGVWFDGINWRRCITAAQFRTSMIARQDLAKTIESLVNGIAIRNRE